MKRTLAAFAVSLSLAACASSSGDVDVPQGFPVADVNQDASITPEEFTRWVENTNAYSRFDLDKNGLISREEYSEGVEDRYATNEYFAAFDLNQNGTLTRGELLRGFFVMYDINRDGVLSEGEFELGKQGLDDDVRSDD